jgi:hypothetical protein
MHGKGEEKMPLGLAMTLVALLPPKSTTTLDIAPMVLSSAYTRWAVGRCAKFGYGAAHVPLCVWFHFLFQEIISMSTTYNI